MTPAEFEALGVAVLIMATVLGVIGLLDSL